MHCPVCGQQQVSDAIRFCSRCGLPLEVIAEVVSHGGDYPEDLQTAARKTKLPTRKQGIKIGLAWLLVIGLFLAPLFAALGSDRAAQAAAALGFMGGIMIMLLSLLFLPKDQKKKDSMSDFGVAARAAGLRGADNLQALPPEQSLPVMPIDVRTPRTSELAQPGSVTESTTKLLEKDI